MRHTRLYTTAGYFSTFVALGIAIAILGPTLPQLAERTGVDLGSIGFLFTARASGYIVGALWGGRLLDRLHGHPVIAAGLGLMALALGVVPVLPVLWLLTLAMLVLGIAEGVVDPGINALMLWVHGDRAGPLVNALHFCWGAGAFLGPVIVAQAVASAGDIRWAYWIAALAALPVLAWLLRLPSPVRRTASQTEPGRQFDSGLVALTTLFFVLYIGAEQGLGGWVTTYSLRLQVASETTAAYLASAFWGALTVGRLLAIPVAARVRPSRIVAAGLAGSLASAFVLLASGRSVGLLWAGTVGLGISLAPIVPTTLALVERRMAVTGKATGWFFAGLGFGGMTIPLLIGQFFERIGPPAMTWAITASLLLATAVFAWLLSYSARMARRKGDTASS